MDYTKRIYCIEGVHDWGDGNIEPTVEPILELLQKTGYWEYLYRNCAKSAELKFRLEKEWPESCTTGSVLYFCTHGARDQVWLDDEVTGLLKMKEWVDCTGCHVHFGGCDTFSGGEDNLRNFMDSTYVAWVSGYAKQVGWVDWSAPAITLALQLFGLLWGVVACANRTKNRFANLRNVEKQISRRFPDCGFKILCSK